MWYWWQRFKCLFNKHDWYMLEDARTFCNYCYREHPDSKFFQSKVFFVIRAVEEEFRLAKENEEKEAKLKAEPLKLAGSINKNNLH